MRINGIIENIIFRNDVNNYTVLQVRSGKAVFTLIGNIAKINTGEEIDAEVLETNHPVYGNQYKIVNYKLLIPDRDLDAIFKFLISISVKGLGEVTIKRIIDNFGNDTIDIIKNTPEKLYGLKGLTDTKISELREKVLDRSKEIELIIELEKYDLGAITIKKIIDEYGDNTPSIIKDNPYKLAMDIEGIGFKICDKIAKINGTSVDSDKRIMAGIIYILETNYASGNVYVSKEYLKSEIIRLLEISDEFNFNDILYDLDINLKIKQDMFDDNEIVFLKKAYSVENNLSKLLFDLKDNITIVTGGPGTGKTYNIKKYLEEASASGLKVALCAPTGRAAKRITEVTGHMAKTIHRLLECVADGANNKIYFKRNEENKLDTDLLIVDEMSMVDEYLMLALIKAVSIYTKIVLVGDVDQLPSVGAGEVLKDMINSNLFTVKKLTEIHRQDEGSNIVINAHLVNEGSPVNFENKCDDFIFSHKDTEEKIMNTIRVLVKENLPKHFDCGKDQIQVICVSKKGSCGTENLNRILQEALNPESFEKNELKVGNTIFRLHDKVMQTSNNYSIPYDVVTDNGSISDRGEGIFNGDIGEIIEIDEDARTMVIKFDDREAYYLSNDLIDLSLAYAITTHKSQGSEYDVVVMPVTKAPYQLLHRKILYTTITRAKKCIIFVGSEDYFYEMLNNKNDICRNSALCSKLYLYDI